MKPWHADLSVVRSVTWVWSAMLVVLCGDMMSVLSLCKSGTPLGVGGAGEVQDLSPGHLHLDFYSAHDRVGNACDIGACAVC